MATILNGKPNHLLSEFGRDRSKVVCPHCSLVSSELTVTKVSTRLPTDVDRREKFSAFAGTQIGGDIPGDQRAVSIAVTCDCGATFEILLAPDNRKRLLFQLFLPGSW